MVHCVILLENNNQVYHAGELLKGAIELHIDKPRNFRGLCLQVRGVEKCMEIVYGEINWCCILCNQRHTVYKSEKVYLNQKAQMFGGEGAAAVEMLAGIYRYDFAVQLPTQLPASFRSKSGSICYDLEAVLDVPWSFNKNTKLKFKVGRHHDLNLSPNLAVPMSMEKLKHFWSLSCQSNPLKMAVSVPCSGFIPGQNIPITVSYFNGSSICVGKTRLWLFRVTQYTALTPRLKSWTDIDKVVKFECDGVKSKQEATVLGNLVIPVDVFKSTKNVASLIHIRYELHVEAVSSGCHGNVTITIPIEIGSIPFNFYGPQEAVHSLTSFAPTH